MDTNARLIALREACHAEDARRAAALLVDAPRLCWAYACEHGFAPLDWEEVDRDAATFIPATREEVACEACGGQGVVRDGERAFPCDACVDGATRRPTPPLWIGRRCVTRADWIARVGSFPEAYLRWLSLSPNRNRWRARGASVVTDPEGFPVTVSAPNEPYEPGLLEPFELCNRASALLGLGHEAWCYRITPGARPQEPLRFTLTRADGPVTVSWVSDGAGFRLPTHHEWRVATAPRPEGGRLGGQWGLTDILRSDMGGGELCWSRGPRDLDRELRLARSTYQGERRYDTFYHPGLEQPHRERFECRLRLTRVAPMARRHT